MLNARLSKIEVIRAPRLQVGDTIGIVSPSFPGHVHFRGKYLHGLDALRRAGFGVREGKLTSLCTHEGYRTASARDRAAELMELFEDPGINAIITTIGGTCSSSLIPYLDYDKIRANAKVFCGYSDITSLHLALLKFAGLATFYGPAVIPSFGEWPEVLSLTRDSFLAATMDSSGRERELLAPESFTRNVLDARSDAWRTGTRTFEANAGPRTLRPGRVEAECVVANLNTLVTSAGTAYFPELDGCVLFIEEMSAPLAEEERDLRHLERLGVFDSIAGLVLSKPEDVGSEVTPLSLDSLMEEIVPRRDGMPIVLDFDCGHTAPMHTLAQRTAVRVEASLGRKPRIWVRGAMVR